MLVSGLTRKTFYKIPLLHLLRTETKQKNSLFTKKLWLMRKRSENWMGTSHLICAGQSIRSCVEFMKSSTNISLNKIWPSMTHALFRMTGFLLQNKRSNLLLPHMHPKIFTINPKTEDLVFKCLVTASISFNTTSLYMHKIKISIFNNLKHIFEPSSMLHYLLFLSVMTVDPCISISKMAWFHHQAPPTPLPPS